MSFQRHATVGVFVLALASAPARACEKDPFLFQLPGETEPVAQERSANIRADYNVWSHFTREQRAFENANVIYLARVQSISPGAITMNERIFISTKVRPLHALKGKLPSGERTLTDASSGGECDDYGDGHGSMSGVGRLVVVFEGMPISNERPRGIDSFRVSEIRTIELLDALREYGKDLED